MSDQLYDEWDAYEAWDAACNKVRELEAAQPIDHRPLLGRIAALEVELLDKVQGMLARGKEIRELKVELAALREENAGLLYECWSLCDSEGLEWHGDVPSDPYEEVKDE
jgi:hypothetical protein